MEFKSLLAALFLHLAAEENYRTSEAFIARYDSDTIKEIAEKEGYTDLVEKFDKVHEAYSGLDSACNEQEVSMYSEQLDKLEEEIEMEI